MSVLPGRNGAPHSYPRPRHRVGRIRSLLAALIAAAVLTSLSAPAAQAAAPAPGAYQSVSPSRLVDTRNGTGLPTGKIAAGGTVTIQIGGKASIPTSGVAAVAVNVNAVSPTASGRLIVWATGATRPNISSVNFVSGRSATALVATRLSSSGAFSVYNSSTKPLDLVVDVSGYWAAGSVTSAGAFVPVTPTRSLDTRSAVGSPTRTDIGDGGSAWTLSWLVAGRAAVPADASAVVASLTVTNVGGPGTIVAHEDTNRFSPGVPWYLSGGSSDVPPPATGLAYSTGVPATELVTIPLSAAGRAELDVLMEQAASPAVDVLVDVVGYLKGGAATAAGSYQPLPIGQVVDQVISGGSTVTFTLPVAGSSTALLQVTASGATASGGIVLYEAGSSVPATRTLSFGANQLASNSALVRTSAGSGVSIKTIGSGSVRVVVDLVGAHRTTPLTATSTVWARGDNSHGGMAVGFRSLGSDTFAPVALNGVVDVDAAGGSSYAVTSDGSLWVWGDNSEPDALFPGGQLGIGSSLDQLSPVKVAALRNVVDVDAGQLGATALLADGTVWRWGRYGSGGGVSSPQQIAGLTGVSALGGDIAVRGDGTVWRIDATAPTAVGCATACWKTAQIVGLTGIRQASSTFALRTDGRVVRWAAGSASVLVSNLSQVSSIEGAQALRADGTVWTLPSAGASAIQVAGLSSVVAISAYGAVTSGGSVWSTLTGSAARVSAPPAAQLAPSRLVDLVVAR